VWLKWTIPLTVCVAGLLGAWAAPVIDTPTPAGHISLVSRHMATLSGADRPFVRYLSWYPTDATLLETRQRVLRWWIHQMSFSPGVSLPVEVAGSNGRLWAVDLRDYRWNAQGWRAMALREPFLREPLIPTEETEELRRAVGSKQDPKTFHAEIVVRADWFFRETVETDRSTAYYDLLYGRFRFGDGGVEKVKKTVKQKVTKEWPGGPDAKGIVHAKGTKYTVEEDVEVEEDVKSPAGFRDFPKDEKDWEKAFGIDWTKTFSKETQIDLDYGAVTEGGKDLRSAGSIVALQNRLLVSLQGPFGGTMISYDVEETTGDRDYAEQFPDLPFKVRDKTIVADASEMLAYLPNGGQAALLVNAQRKRVEFAGQKVAVDHADKRNEGGKDILNMNIGVRTPGSCVICHGPASGYILPKNLLEEVLKKGIDLRIKDREVKNRTEQFYLRWEKRILPWREPYEALVEATTKDKDGNPFTVIQLVKEFQEFRNDYDAPVNATRAAAELGVPVDLLKQVAARSTKLRPGQLVRDMEIPRRTFEVDVFRELVLHYDAGKKK
jgi:hypothetical protein